MKLKKNVSLSFIVLFILLFITSLNITKQPDANTTHQPETSIYELISMTNQLSVFHELVEAADMGDMLNQESPLTVFLPVDNAFEALPDGVLDTYMEDDEALEELISNHIYEGEVLSGNLNDGQELVMKSGEAAVVGISDLGLELDNASIIQVDVDASNGLIHVVNEVLLP